MLHATLIFSLFGAAVSGALTESNLKTHVGSLSLAAQFSPVKEAYWTGYPHHRRTPFAVSPDGKSAYLAYLDASETGVYVQQVDPSTFAAVGDAITVKGGKEAGGLVAHNDGFALLTNEKLASGTTNADNAPVPVIYRYTSGTQTWKTFLGGPDVPSSMGLMASPDINGDLVYSEKTKQYGAYIVVTAYSGDANGHFGDAIRYVSDAGKLETIQGASSDWGCSHNTGIAFEAADEAPFASVCAEDHGAIWLNTGGLGSGGVKVSNENVTNGASGESLGGMSGSYSSLARFIDSSSYILAWVSKGAKELKADSWMGAGFTQAVNRTPNRNVAIATFSDKKTMDGEEASSTIGPGGDEQVNWLTTGTADYSNAHVAAFDSSNALVTYEEIANPTCGGQGIEYGFGCEGAFTGSYFQLVNKGAKVGEAVKSTNVYVSGDMVTMGDGRICWPYVDMTWSLEASFRGSSVQKMSFACMSLDGSATPSASSTAAASSTSAVSSAPASTKTTSSSTQAVAPTSVAEVDATSTAPAAGVTTTSATSAPVVEPTTSAGTTDTSLPEFSIVTSGATTTPQSTTNTFVATTSVSAPAASETESTDVAPVPTELPQTTTAAEEPEPTEVVPSTSCTKSKATATDVADSTAALPIGTGIGESPFPIPSGVFPSGAFPTGAFPTGLFPTGAFPSGWPTRGHGHSHPRPTGTYGRPGRHSSKPRPTASSVAGVGGAQPSKGAVGGTPSVTKSPCASTFTTIVKSPVTVTVTAQ